MEGRIEARAKREIAQDRLLAKGLLKGKVLAWERFYALYAEPLYRFALARLDGNSEGAVEVVQSVMATAVELIGKFDAKKGSLWSWLCGIVVNKIRESRRDAGRTAKLKERMRESAPGEGNDESGVGNILDIKLALSAPLCFSDHEGGHVLGAQRAAAFSAVYLGGVPGYREEFDLQRERVFFVSVEHSGFQSTGIIRLMPLP